MDVRSRVKDGLQAVAGASEVPRSDREIYLSLSEYARRLGGDVPKVTDLTAFELKVFSQNGEDGVIGEILRRIGAPERGGFFVEFGAETGLETNSAVLAEVRGWGGLYIEAADASFAALEARYRHRPDVTTLQSMVTPVNVESLFEHGGVPEEPDLLSIDVDGAEYWLWKALESYRPKVVVAEFNAKLDPARRLTQSRDAGVWDRTDYVGASLGAFTEFPYRLVHVELAGNNAFFVRDDLPGEWSDPVVRGPNYFLRGMAHRPDPADRPYVDLDSTSS